MYYFRCTGPHYHLYFFIECYSTCYYHTLDFVMEKAIEIIIAEDKEILRKAIIGELRQYNIKIAGEASNGRMLLKLLQSKRPDVILLDLDMPIMDGNETMNHLMRDYPETKVLIFTLHNEFLLMENYLARGARGFVPKDEIAGDITILVKAIMKIRDGGIYIHPKLGDKRRFTKRQKEILPLLFEGKTNEQIAAEVGLSKRGMEKSRRRIYEKVGTDHGIGFYKFAFSKGLQFLSRLMPQGGLSKG
jgi:two-component system response regulator NreC